MEQVMIRKLREDDLSQVLAIEEATAPVPWTYKIFRDCFFADYPGYVIEVVKKIVCFGFFVLHGEECHLLNLGVHPSFHRQGLGTQMLNHVIANAKQRGGMMIYLEVRESNTKAINLYKKQG